MSPEEIKARARRIPEEVFTQGDLTVADEVLAPGADGHALCPSVLGVEGVKRWALALRRAFPDLSVMVEDEIAEGDTVVLRLTYSGTHAGAFFGLPPTGNYATWQAMECRRLGSNGKFVEQWMVADLLSVLRQLGAFPPVSVTRPDAADASENSTHVVNHQR
jgi:predicted ester cyclase